VPATKQPGCYIDRYEGVQISIGAVDYAIFQLMCHAPSVQFGLPNVSAFTSSGARRAKRAAPLTPECTRTTDACEWGAMHRRATLATS
jgi:hypothetical protein